MTTLALEDIQPFINFVNANLGTKVFTSQAPSAWASASGKPLVATGDGYGVSLGAFPSPDVTSVNGLVGDVVLDKTHIGLSNVPDVNCTNAANITTGLLSLSVIPAAALERLVHVADEAARFLLAIEDVQNGDVVQQDDTEIMYKVVDDTQLDSAAGYNQFTAGIAAAVNWSGILGMPSNISDMASATSLEKHTWVYTAGAWASVAPATARSNLDIPVKGEWDMRDVTHEERVNVSVYPPLDVDVTSVGALAFPYVSPDGSTHGHGVAAGAPSSGGYYFALSTKTAQGLFLGHSDGDLPVPTEAGTIKPLLLEFSTTSLTLPQRTPSNPFTPSVLDTVYIDGFGAGGVDQMAITIQAVCREASGGLPTGFYIFSVMINTLSGISYAGTQKTYDLQFPQEGPARVLLYFDADTRQVGLMVDSVDLGWYSRAGSPMEIPATVSHVGVIKQCAYIDIEVGDPIIGEEFTTRHSITLADVSETSPYAPFSEWGDYQMVSVPPSAPEGTEVSNRFLVQHGGAFHGVSAETGDIVEFLSATGIFTYPQASTVVRTVELSAVAADVSTLQADVSTLQADVSTLQSDVGAAQSDILVLQAGQRNLRELFLDSGEMIVGFSRSGADWDGASASVGEAVIVTPYNEVGSILGVTGDFLSLGASPGQVAVRKEVGWDVFTPVHGDEYRYGSWVSDVAALPIKMVGKIRCEYTLSASGTESWRHYAGALSNPMIAGAANAGAWAGAVEREAGNSATGFNDVVFSNLPLKGDMYRLHGWSVLELPNARMAERVVWYLVTGTDPLDIAVGEDETVVAVVDFTTVSHVSGVNVRLRTPNEIPVSLVGATRTTPPFAATRRGRVVIFPKASSLLAVDCPIHVSRVRGTDAGTSTPIAEYVYRAADISRPSPVSDVTCLYADYEYSRDQKAMIFDYEFFPLAESDVSAVNGELGHLITRRDGNDSVAYSYQTGAPDGQISPAAVHADRPHLEALNYVIAPYYGYNTHSLRNEYQIVLPKPVRQGQRLVVRFSTPLGVDAKVWSTASTMGGAAVQGMEAGTLSALPVDVAYSETDTFEFLAVREVDAIADPYITFTNDLVWAWLRGYSAAGAGALAGRATATVTTSSIAVNTTEQTTITLSKSYRVLKVSADGASRVRLYATAAHQAADAARPIGVAATGDHGMYLEAILGVDALSLLLSPQVDGTSFEAVPGTAIPCSITNLGLASTAVTVTLTYLSTE